MKKSTKITLMVFVIIGVILRIYDFGFRSLNCDEVFTLDLVKKPVLDVLWYSLFTENSPPLFYIVSQASFVLSGFSDIAIRYPSVIFGVLTIPAMYYLGEVYRDELTGLYCAGFTLVLFPLVYYSRFARPYAMVFFLFVLGLIQFIRIGKTTNAVSCRDFVLLGILAGLSVWTHLFAIVPVTLLLLSLFLTNDKRMAIDTSVIFGIIISPLIFILFSVQEKLVHIISLGFGINDIFAYTSLEFFNLAFPIFTILIVYGIYKDRTDILTIALFTVAVTTIVIACILSSYIPITPRYYQVVSAILIVIAASACSILTERLSDTRKIIVAIAVVIMILTVQYTAFISYYTILRAIC